MVFSSKYICNFLLVLFVAFTLTSAGRRRKACDGSKNEVFSSCADLCNQVTCNDRTLHVTPKPCPTECRPGCICKQGYVRRNQTTDMCVSYC